MSGDAHDIESRDVSSLDGDERDALRMLSRSEGITASWDGSVITYPEARAGEVGVLVDAVAREGAALREDGPTARRVPPGFTLAYRIADGREIAGGARRIIGSLVDLALMLTVYLVLLRPLLLDGAAAEVAVAVVGGVYHVVSVGTWGRTVGKVVAGTEVVSLASEDLPGCALRSCAGRCRP